MKSQQFRKRRLALGYSVAALAQLFGRNRSTIWRYEQPGAVIPPSAALAMAALPPCGDKD